MPIYSDIITAGVIQAVAGLLLTGAGLSMAIDAGSKKARGRANASKL